MRRLLLLVLALPAALFFSASRSDREVAFVVPAGWPKPHYDFSANPLEKPVIYLGRALFHDPALSRNNTVSCASCHLPQTGFSHTDHELSHGIHNRIGTRNSPTLANLAWGKTFMWDGAVHHLDMQALAPITNPLEMDEDMAHLTAKLQAGYGARYKAAFGDTLVTGERTLKAISQFLLTLVSANARYDKVQRGQAAFNPYELHGYQLFKQHCASCHAEPLFTNGNFENNGLPIDTSLNDLGRMKVTGCPADRARFKVPTLRNVEVTYPYMHDGRFASLQMVLFHYASGVAPSPTLAGGLKGGLPLSADDKRDLIAFLKTLTDESFLNDPTFQPL